MGRIGRFIGKVVVEGTEHMVGHVFGRVPRVRSRVYHGRGEEHVKKGRI
jgi:hypothetical protein